MKILKVLCAIGFLAVLVSNIWSISGWIEARGVYDDICYLRQAHLFERFGLRGIDTNIAFDDDQYFTGRLKAIGFPEWNDVKRFPCHTFISDADKYVLQYPPGTGFILSLFPAGFQVIPLYVLTSIVAVGFSLIALSYAATFYQLLLVTAFGDSAIYLMINPTKASYSVAPTMMVCALAGFLTAKLFTAEPRHRPPAVGAARSPDRPRRQFPPAQPVSGRGLLPVSRRRVSAGAQQGDFSARARVWCCIPDRDHADADCQCDQCGQSVLDHL